MLYQGGERRGAGGEAEGGDGERGLKQADGVAKPAFGEDGQGEGLRRRRGEVLHEQTVGESGEAKKKSPKEEGVGNGESEAGK